MLPSDWTMGELSRHVRVFSITRKVPLISETRIKSSEGRQYKISVRNKRLTLSIFLFEIVSRGRKQTEMIHPMAKFEL